MGRPLNCRVSDPTLSLLRRLGPDRVSVKLSGAYRLGRVKPQALAQSLLAELGPEALLWGSDWPCTNFETWADYPALYASLSQWLGDQHVELVLCANPLRLYWGTGPDA
jgi:predicted TIM-barrel fold metal-dependent hydrolase